MEPIFVVVIVQLMVSLYLSWKVFSLEKKIDGVESVLGYLLVKFGISGVD